MTSVPPQFRSAQLQLRCTFTWKSPMHDKQAFDAIKILAERLQKYGKGVYLNEAPYYLDNWKVN